MSKKIENKGLEAPTSFYRVDREGTLSYLAHTASGINDVVVRVADMHANIQKNGNIKTGKEWLMNTLPGEHPIMARGKALTNYCGSCQGCCDGCEKFCYAIHGAQQHHNAVLPATIKNLVLYRKAPTRFESEIDTELSNWKLGKGDDEKVFRWHASGEIEDYAYLEMMMRLARKHPEVHFYTYTKKFMLINRYLDEYKDFPTNFVMNLSVWGDNLKNSGFNPAYLSKVQCFEWKDEISAEDYNKGIHCRSVIHNKDGEKKGHLDHNMNCKKCGLCWKGKCKGKTIKVYNH